MGTERRAALALDAIYSLAYECRLLFSCPVRFYLLGRSVRIYLMFRGSLCFSRFARFAHRDVLIDSVIGTENRLIRIDIEFLFFS